MADPQPMPAIVEKDDIDRLIKALAAECALHFAYEGQGADMLARSVAIWERALMDPEAQAELTRVLVTALHRERARSQG